MKCLKCFEGTLHIGITTLAYEREGSAIQVTVEGIPAEICPVCGEVYLSESVAQQIYDTVDYLLEEAAKGSREDFEAFLAAVPDVDPVEEDKLD